VSEKIHGGTTAVKRSGTPKSELIVNQKTLEIIATDFPDGSKHDFSLFKDIRSAMYAHMCTLADLGYQGILDWHQNS